METQVYQADGEPIDVILFCVPRLEPGTLASMITVITDLRELKLAEAALRAAVLTRTLREALDEVVQRGVAVHHWL